MLIGYARVSTADQNPDLQEDALQKARCEKIFRDVASGAVDSRKGLAEAIDYARDGDTLVVLKLDRLGRSLKHLIETVNGLAARRVGFQSLRESMDTTTSGGKLIFHVFGAPAEWPERSETRARIAISASGLLLISENQIHGSWYEPSAQCRVQPEILLNKAHLSRSVGYTNRTVKLTH
jgi:DNA invertase Pin-like site-specific DNA recombinase